MITVAVIDDDPAVTELVQATLRREEGIEVVAIAHDADEGIRIALDLRPSVAIVDAHMPGGGGQRVCAELRRRAPEITTLAYSGSGDTKAVLSMLREGAVGYVVKGSEVSVLIETVKRAARGEGTLPTEVAAAVLNEVRRQALTSEEGLRASFQQDLDEIIQQRRFDAVFQPIYDLHSGHAVGIEALSRFTNGSPAVWFERAWALGRGIDLEILAIERALEALNHLPQTVYLSLNVAPATIETQRLLDTLSVADARRLVLEVTENRAIDRPGFFGQSLANLRDLGVRVAADDVGAGYANFIHLIHLAPDILKLDRALVSAIDGVPMKQAMARSLIDFAAAIGARVVAEGVEQVAEWHALRQLGVQDGQGYLLARPTSLPVPLEIVLPAL